MTSPARESSDGGRRARREPRLRHERSRLRRSSRRQPAVQVDVNCPSHPTATVVTMPIQVARLTEATSDVVEQLNVLIPQLKPLWAPVSVTSLAQLIESPTRVYVARCEGSVVGITLLVPHRHLGGLRFHVEDVVVDTSSRRRGIATRLLATAMADAPEDVISFDLRSHSFRREAHELYVSLGFEASDTTVFRRSVRGSGSA
jgi:ribosomal protein S18 acetylase RimI-like enzyme